MVSQRALASLTMDSFVPVKVGGACGGFLYLSGAILEYTMDRAWVGVGKRLKDR